MTRPRLKAPPASRAVDDLMADPRFVAAVEDLAAKLGHPVEEVTAEARTCLLEMATTQRRTYQWLWMKWARFTWSRAYDLEVDPEQIDHLRQLSSAPLVFLPSHKSNLDAYVMCVLLHDHGLPPNHIIGGINMAFWPIGPIGRRVGAVFIRRRFGGDEVYKLALRQYLAYLASARCRLEWYIEGGRSRTGKLLPPKMGLLSYLAQGVEELGLDEVYLVPTSIVYDRLQEIADMTAESRGAEKRPEGIMWLVRYAYSMRSHMGRVKVRFGEPVALRAALASGDEFSLALSKAAFEVCTRINRATPVTSTSLVTLALLGTGGPAVTRDEAIDYVRPLRDYVRRRHLPGTAETAEVETRAGMGRTLAELASIGVVETFGDGAESVYRISPEHDLTAAFYRNVVIHWFVNRAIVELSLVAAAESTSPELTQVALDEAFRLRDLLKFEFFFSEKSEFAAELAEELDLITSRWPAADGVGLQTLGASLAESGAIVAVRILRSFLEAYWVVADQLADHGATMVDTEDLLVSCLGVARQYQLQRVIVSGEANSLELFRNALKLAANRGLLDPDNPLRADGRTALAAELKGALRRLEVLDRWEGRRRGKHGDDTDTSRGGPSADYEGVSLD